MGNGKGASILGKVLIFMAVAIVCISIGLSIFYFTGRSEVFKMQLDDGSNSYVNVGETFDIAVSRTDAKSAAYSVVSENEKIIKFVEKVNSTTDKNTIIWKFEAVGGGNTAVRLDTVNEDYKTLNISIMVGDGSAEHPYFVRNANDLASITTKTTDTTDSSAMKNFVQVYDIDLTYYLTKSKWFPANFCGNYDGAGHTISGLKFVEANQKCGGLFRTISLNSKVHNLNLVDFDIKGDYSYLGSLAGISNGDVYLVSVVNTKLESVHNITSGESAVKVGGLIGATGLDVGVGSINEVTPASVNSASSSWEIRVRGCSISNESLIAKNGAVIGGLVGKTLSTMLSNNFCYLNANGMTNSTVGGLVGEIRAYNSNDVIFRNAVLNNYVVIESISGTSTSIGALIGQNIVGTESKNFAFREETTYHQNRVLGNYYFNKTDKTLSALATYSDISSSNRKQATKLTELQMQKKESFVGYDSKGSTQGWNFDTVWAIDPTKNDGFPYIQTGAVLSRDYIFDVRVDDVVHTMYTVTFETNGGASVEARTIESGHSFNDENWSWPTTSKENHVFIAWYTNPDLTVPFELSMPITANITLYAKWQENTPPVVEDTTWTVGFNTLGGTTIEDISITKGKSFNEVGKLLPKSTRDGFDFIAWYSDSNYSVLFNEDVRVTQNLTLYAKWEKKENPVVVEKTALEKLQAMFADDLADDGVYNNVYNIDWDIDGRNADGAFSAWTPIGTVTNPFRGEFNVKGTISNLKIVSNNSSYVGFFGVIGQDGAVNGVTLKNIVVEVNNVKNPIIGILAGTSLGRIENAKVVVDSNYGIKTNNCGYVIAGGIAGISNCVIDNCQVSAPMDIKAEKACVGGLVGSMSDGILSNSVYTKGNCEIKLTTTPKAEDETKSYDYAGGAVGCLVDGAIERCATTPKIVITKNGDYETYVGGIAGCLAETVVQRDKANLLNCSAENIDISGEVAGGLVGLMKINAIKNGIFDCVSQSYASGDVFGAKKAGGLVGSMVRGGMINCYTTCCLSGGTVAGIAVDIMRSGDDDYARAKNCFVNITLGEEHGKAYISTESKVFKVTNDTVPFGLFVKQEKLAGYVEHCVIVDNFGGEAQYGLQWFTPGTPLVGVIDWNHLNGNDDEKRVTADAAKNKDTFTSVGFDESIWEFIENEFPKLYQN